ncbi:DUF6511 domain-containing protein [Roseovarius sp. SK2]|uniref:DUF6511 domain-containing protein n=1 Tax=Roseovarius TaxID=74030 RepID=UPI00237BF9F2|nr:DUF6511 domain-containing protein [Roseovarius sp. SK2]MDD9727209.1 DUF6511 domain-containing protein [Roseovarius sp. SK2]
MITKPTTEEKIQAILDARAPVAEYLQSIGKVEAFDTFSKDDICGLIRAAHEGVQKGLRSQMQNSFDDEISF